MGCGASKDSDPDTTASSSSSREKGSSSSGAADAPPVEDSNFILKTCKHENFLEHYDEENELGRGGFAVVYKGKNKSTGEYVAIKHIQKKFVDPQELKCLEREIDIMMKVNHPNVLRLLDLYETDEEVVMVIELVTGGELFYKIVDRGAYSEADAAGIVRQLMTGIAYLHSQGIAHRDLKPENILCEGEDDAMTIKIADFGLSKAFSGGDTLKTACGTPDYAAPEVLSMEGSYTMAVDMWSAGVITYVLLCGYPPFYAKEQRELFQQILKADYDFPEEDWEAISDNAKDFINSLLKVDAGERMTAEQALQHPWLKETAAGEGHNIRIGKALGAYNERRKEQSN